MPPRHVVTDARSAFRVVFTGRLLPLAVRFETALPTTVDAADEVGDDVVMFKDADVVVFLWSRRVPGGSRVITEVFGSGETTTAALCRVSREVRALFSRGRDRFESETVPTGPACLVIDSRTGAAAKTWHSEWLTL
jgi:hypothetical protein